MFVRKVNSLFPAVVSILSFVVTARADTPLNPDYPIFYSTIAEHSPEEHDELSKMVDYEQLWTLSCSSQLADQEGYGHGPECLMDGLVETAWVEGAEGNGIGESVTFKPYVFTDDDLWEDPILLSMPIQHIYLRNGYCKNPETWEANGRVSMLLLKFNNIPLCYIQLLDTMELQNISISSRKLFEIRPDLNFFMYQGESVTFEIVEVFPGEENENAAITTIEFYIGIG